MEEVKTSITVSDREIEIVRKLLPVQDLHFFLENPRIHSIIHNDTHQDIMDDASIQEILESKDHVKQLVSAIKKNGGLTDPLLVRSTDNVVLEGNSRLAAYHVLIRKDAVKWGMVKCDIVVDKIEDSDVVTLLSSYHIIGRKSWDKFEQAGMFWRLEKDKASKKDILEKAASLGLSTKMVSHWIDVYSLMVKENDITPSKWSYYDELLKTREAKHLRESKPETFAKIAKRIANGDIKKAEDVRDKLKKVLKHGKAPVEKFANGELSLEESYDCAEAGGVTNNLYNRLNRFRIMISNPGVNTQILGCSDEIKHKTIFELKKIHTHIDHLLEKLEGK